MESARLPKVIVYAPTALLIGLVAWSVATFLPFLPAQPSFLALAAVGLSASLGLEGTRRPNQWTDRAALGLVGSAFLGIGISVARMELQELYLFIALALLTAQMMRFRTTILPLTRLGSSEKFVGQSLRSVYMSFLSRAIVVAALVYLLSVVSFATASLARLDLTTEVTAFLLAAAVLLALLGVSRIRR